MKMLVRRAALHPSATPVDIDAVKLFLRVDHDDDDDSLEIICSAAAAELEHFAQVALIAQTIICTITRLENYDDIPLPIGPAVAGSPVTVEVNGAPFTDFSIIAGFRPLIRWDAPFYALMGATVDIEYTAGFGVTDASVPADLQQAIMSQAALHYDGLDATGGKQTFITSPHFARLAARYRGVAA